MFIEVLFTKPKSVNNLVFINSYMYRQIVYLGAGEIGQRLKVLTALREDPSTYNK